VKKLPTADIITRIFSKSILKASAFSKSEANN